MEINNKLKEKKSSIYVDKFEKMLYLDSQKQEKTLFVQIPNYHDHNTIEHHLCFTLRQKNSGLPVRPMRIKIAKKIHNKTSAKNAYMFVEFEDVSSITNVTKLNAKRIILAGAKAHLAGSNTFTQIRRSVR